MENRKRNIQMKFYVTEEEKRLIDEKMKPVSYTHLDVYKRQVLHTRWGLRDKEVFAFDCQGTKYLFYAPHEHSMRLIYPGSGLPAAPPSSC